VSVQASYQGISYELSKTRDGQWRWTFIPPTGPSRSGRVRGELSFAQSVVRRAIDVWRLMNRSVNEAA
jgi:hypothetical protein